MIKIIIQGNNIFRHTAKVNIIKERLRLDNII